MFNWLRSLTKPDEVDSTFKEYLPFWVAFIEICNIVYHMDAKISYTLTGMREVIFDFAFNVDGKMFIYCIQNFLLQLTDDDSYGILSHEVIGGMSLSIFHKSILEEGEF